jgi:glutathione-regulated potassium-efflux system ancillary protein KefG
MPRILIVFAHPAFQRSHANACLLDAISDLTDVTIHDLYQIYPNGFIDVRAEQALVDSHDIIVFQHPFYWYSCPGLLKEWMDLVFEHGYAYGGHATALKGKKLLSVITAGGTHSSYRSDGYNKHSFRDFLLPFQQTANLCGMTYLPPFVVDGIHKKQDQARLKKKAEKYRQALEGLRDERFDARALAEADYLTALVEVN